MHVCAHDGALLVNAAGIIPEAPEDFVWPEPSPSIGCSHLVCERCGAHVRSVSGWRTSGALGAADISRLFSLDLGAWEPTALATRDPVARAYLCRCGAVEVTFPRALHEGGIADDHPAPVGWHCGGHPPLRLPILLDGVPLDASSIDVELVGRILRGEAPSVRPTWLGPEPAEWLVRLHYELADRALAATLAQGVAAFLAPERPELAGALRFFTAIPRGAAEPARSRLVGSGALAAMSPALAESRAPFPPNWSIGRLVERLRRRWA